MSAAAPTRKRIVVKSGAAAPTRVSPALADRLDEWLALWGDWVRAYQANTVSTKSMQAGVFRDVATPRQWDTTLEVLESLRLEDRTLRELDACVSDLGKLHYMILHWHYARAFRTKRAATEYANQLLPADGSNEYEILLDAARTALAAKVVLRRVLVPE